MLTPLFSLASKRYHAHLSLTHGTPDDKLPIVAGLMQLTITKYERPDFWEIGRHQLYELTYRKHGRAKLISTLCSKDQIQMYIFDLSMVLFVHKYY